MGAYITEDEEFIKARYHIDVLEAKQAHGLMLRTSFQNLVRARINYEAAKKEADELYLISRKKLFNRLRKELKNHHIDRVALELAERHNNNVEHGDRDKLTAARGHSRNASDSGMEQAGSTG